MQSKKALELFLKSQMDNGNLSCMNFIVHDLIARKDDLNERYSSEPINAKYYSAFRYYVLGKVITHYKNRKQNKKNSPKFNNTSPEQNSEAVKNSQDR